MRAKSSKQRCPALCILRLELLCSCRVGGCSGHLTASGSRCDFAGVDHERCQTFGPKPSVAIVDTWLEYNL